MDPTPFALTDYPEVVEISEAALVNKGWIRGAGEDQVLFIVQVRNRSCGYLTLAKTPDVLWIRELYLDGRTWRGSPKGDSYPVLHRGLGKLILAWFDQEARRRGRSLGIFTTRSLGLLKACDHLFGDRCQYHVTDGDPPQTLYRQRGLRWLAHIETYSATLPPDRVLVFRRVNDRLVDDRVAGETLFLDADDRGTLGVVDQASGRRYGQADGLLVSIGPSVDIVVFR